MVLGARGAFCSIGRSNAADLPNGKQGDRAVYPATVLKFFATIEIALFAVFVLVHYIAPAIGG